jgi:hypothetical protein
MTLLWKEPGNFDTAILTKKNNDILTLSVGDFITYEGRPEGVKITCFTRKDSDTRGPIGLCYLPWRPKETRWATEVWTLKGNPRHLIAFPVGLKHFGEQCDWNTVELKDDGICPIELPSLPLSPLPDE